MRRAYQVENDDAHDRLVGLVIPWLITCLVHWSVAGSDRYLPESLHPLTVGADDSGNLDRHIVERRRDRPAFDGAGIPRAPCDLKRSGVWVSSDLMAEGDLEPT